MSLEDSILALLKQLQSTSQQPACQRNLAAKLKVEYLAVECAINSLYESKQVNVAIVTRGEVTDREVWPTGIKASNTPKTSIFDNQPAIISLPEIEIPTTMTTTTEKSFALKILEFIEQNPKCTSIEISTAIGKPFSEGYIPGYIDRGHVIIDKNDKARKIYSLAEGITAKSAFYNKERTVAGHKKQPPEIKAPRVHENVQPAINFLDAPEVKVEELIKPDKGHFIVGTLEEKIENPLDIQIGGDHYKSMVIQPVQYILANNIGFVEGNIIKYISRYKAKNGLQDLKKARHFIDILIEQQTKQLNQGETV
ncbi:MAG: DUF3310 domain-containing protein [Methylotenera sp.]